MSNIDITEILTEEQSERIAKQALKSIQKYHENLVHDIYAELEGFLYEHYENVKDKIERKLIEKITERFVSNPNDYQFQELRSKIIQENLEVLREPLTDAIIQQSLERILEGYTHKKHYWNWKWKDGIAKFISEHPHLFEDDERVQTAFLRENARLRNVISRYEEERECGE